MLNDNRKSRTAVLAAMAVIVMAGPFLVIPDLLPSWLGPRFLGIGIAVTIALSLVLGGSRWRENWPLPTFVLCVAVGWYVGRKSAQTWNHSATVGLGLLVMTTVPFIVRTTRQLAWATGAVLLLSALALTLGMAGIESTPPKFLPISTVWLPQVKYELKGLESSGFVNPNALAGASLLVAPLAALLSFAPRTALGIPVALRASSLATTAVVAVTLILTQSRAAWLALIAVMFFLAVCDRRRRWQWVSVAGLLALFVVAIAFASVTGPERQYMVERVVSSMHDRLEFWKQGVEALRGSPFWGIGLNRFREVFRPPAGAPSYDIAHAHNIFLQVALDVGLVGLFAYLALLVLVIKRAFRAMRLGPPLPVYIGIGGTLALVGVHAFGTLDAIPLGAKLGILQWLIMGLILAADATAIQQRPVGEIREGRTHGRPT